MEFKNLDTATELKRFKDLYARLWSVIYSIEGLNKLFAYCDRNSLSDFGIRSILCENKADPFKIRDRLYDAACKICGNIIDQRALYRILEKKVSEMEKQDG